MKKSIKCFKNSIEYQKKRNIEKIENINFFAMETKIDANFLKLKMLDC